MIQAIHFKHTIFFISFGNEITYIKRERREKKLKIIFSHTSPSLRNIMSLVGIICSSGGGGLFKCVWMKNQIEILPTIL